jgi:hypothetical protein
MHNRAAAAVAPSEGGLYSNWKAFGLSVVPEPVQSLTWLGQLMKAAKVPAGLVTAVGKQGYALMMQAAILVGTALAVIYRKQFNLNLDFVVLAPVGIALVAFSTVMPVIDYGLFRMLQQELVFLALPITLGTMKLLGWLRLRSKRLRLTLVTGALAAFFLVVSGWLGALTGGTNAALPLANSGFYYDAYYTSAQDEALFSWLQTNYPTGYPIDADSFTRMKIMANTGIVTLDGISPGEISRQSYVVLTGANVTDDRVALYVPDNGSLAFYQYPMGFLDNHKDLIYTTNATRVYH